MSKYVYAYADPNIPDEIRLKYRAEFALVAKLKSAAASEICPGNIRDELDHQRVSSRIILKKPLRFDKFSISEFKNMMKYIRRNTNTKQKYTLTTAITKKKRQCLHMSYRRYDEVYDLMTKYINDHNATVVAEANESESSYEQSQQSESSEYDESNSNEYSRSSDGSDELSDNFVQDDDEPIEYYGKNKRQRPIVIALDQEEDEEEEEEQVLALEEEIISSSKRQKYIWID